MSSSAFSGADNKVVSADEDIKSTSLPTEPSSSSQSEMKRVAAKEKIERYYYQLTDGCGDPHCDNELCVSSSLFLYPGIDRNEAAGKAVELFKNRSRLCDVSSKKLSKVSDCEDSSSLREESLDVDQNNSSTVSTPSLNYDAILKKNGIVVLTEEKLNAAIDEYTRTNSWIQLATLIFSTFSNPESLMKSFVKLSTPYVAAGTAPTIKKPKNLEPVGNSVDAEVAKVAVKTLEAKNKSMDVDTSRGGDNSDDDDYADKMGEGSAVDGPAYQNKEVDELSNVVVYADIEDEATSQASFLTKLFGNVEEGLSSLSAWNYEVTVAAEALNRCYERLSTLSDSNVYCEPLKTALVYLSRKLESGFHESGHEKDNLLSNPTLPNIYATILEMPLLDSLELLETAVPNFYRTVRLLPVKCQVALVRHWAKRYGEVPNGSASMKRVVCAIQQMITVRVVMTPWSVLDQTVNDDDAICGAVVLLKLFYYASMLGGRMDDRWLERQERKKGKSSTATKKSSDSNKQPSSSQATKFDTSLSISDEEDDDVETDRVGSSDSIFRGFIDISKERHGSSSLHRDPLGEELGLRSMDCREPLLPAKEFVNETLSEAIEMDKDYAYYRVRPEWRFSFMANPFVLTTTAKQMGLYFDNRIRMFDERRATLFQNVLYAGSSTASMTAPYLRLIVRRDHVVGDALVNLETITMNSPQDLKKQLFVEFEGEQGVDEGGVSKEFFQLIVEELFNPDFGMFRLDEETQTFWFNEFSFENDAEFTLIGILIGLAIYNNIILDVRFPMVLYRKLLSRRGNFDDLLLARPVLGKSLLSLLNYEGNVEDLMQTFTVSTTDVFGNVQTHELKPSGSDALVNNENRKEFVELYADFLLNKSVEKQFKAFRRGFRLVTDESPLAQLFNAEELELLICGSDENSDFHALEESTEYDGGYKKDTPVIRYFWETVHEMIDEQKKKLLQFTTGSDRVPIGGLSKLKLIIARNGQDTDRLPTSHTCFNVLLLPEYSSKDKLKERLLKAITYSKGFGML